MVLYCDDLDIEEAVYMFDVYLELYDTNELDLEESQEISESCGKCDGDGCNYCLMCER